MTKKESKLLQALEKVDLSRKSRPKVLISRKKLLFRDLKQDFKKRRTQYCKHGRKCRFRRCNFAHSKDELKMKDYLYAANPIYREKECQRINCKLAGCIYYHDIKEKRIEVLKTNFEKLVVEKQKPKQTQKNLFLDDTQENGKLPAYIGIMSGANKQKSKVIAKRSINFSSLIPPLTQFKVEDLNNLIDGMLKIVSKLNILNKAEKKVIPKSASKDLISTSNQEQTWVNRVILNLSSNKAKLIQQYQFTFLILLKHIPSIKFQYNLFSYERNSKRGQLSYSMKTDSVINFVIQDIDINKPRDLKLNIRSLNKKWECFEKLMKSVQNASESIHKIDLSLKEFMCPKYLDQMSNTLEATLNSLVHLKVINLKVQFDYKEGGGADKEFVDRILKIVADIKKRKPDLKVQLNFFRIVIDYSHQQLEIYSERSQRKTPKQREMINKMFKNSQYHKHFITKFSELFEPSNLKQFTMDFSNMILTQKRKVEEKPRMKYEGTISAIISAVQGVFQKVYNNSINKITLRFFGFYYNCEAIDKQKIMSYKFLMNFQLFFQNTPVVAINSFQAFAEVLNKKMNYKYKYSNFEGNLFTSKNHKKYRQKNYSENKKFLHFSIHKASEFLKLVTKDFQNVFRFRYFGADVFHFVKILTMYKKQITHAKALDIDINTTYYPKKQQSTLSLFKLNKDLDFQRRKILYVFAKFKRILKKESKFISRKEIMQEIYKLSGLQQQNVPLFDFKNTNSSRWATTDWNN